MPQFLVTIHRPDNCDHAAVIDQAARRDIDVVNEAMVAAGVRVFVGGLYPTSSAKSIHLRADGILEVADSRYLKASEYVDGFWVLETVDIDEAIAWGSKAAIACRASVEVRPFY